MSSIQMMGDRSRVRVAVFTALSILCSPSVPLLRAQTAVKPAAAKPAPAPPATADGGWPRAYSTPGGAAIVVYQPQVATWVDQKHAILYAATAYTPKGATQPALGTVKLEVDTKVALDERLVSFDVFKITEANFPKLPKEQIQDITKEITAAIPQAERVIALERVLANIDSSTIIPKNVQGVKADPPPIFFSKTPAILVNLDGDAIWSPIRDNDLQYAVNTNWDYFQHQPTKTYYLRSQGAWLTTTDPKGTWTAAGKLPDSFAKLPADDNWKEVKAALPGQKLTAKELPRVFTSNTPSELILLTGEPSYVAVSNTSSLLWVSNTEADVFRMGRTGAVYFLVAGRWFSAADFTGPWTFASEKLPAEFKKIPVEHQRSRVLASVPGTSQAAEAVLLAQIPQTARVSKTLKAPDVAYSNNKAEFKTIPPTKVQQAVNTDKDIFKVGDLFYMCFQGVWFASKSADGPWEVTGKVPKEIYEIPISSSAYNVTYVTVVADDNDDVELATALAFTGMMVAWGCVVWGSGYYYPPYYGGGFYYGHYPSYGYGARYNPWTGAYSRGAVAYGPYGGAGVGARYNPRTGTYSRGAAAWGPGGAVGAAGAYNPRTGAVGATRQGSNVYGSWGSTAVARGDQWAKTSHVTNRATGATTRVTEGSGGGTAVTRNGAGAGNNSGVVKTGNGDIYAGRDGNVYKKDAGGGWQQSDGGSGWSNTDRATTGQAGQLNKDSAARAEGATRTRDSGTVRSSGGGYNSGAGSYRPSGGGMSRGGGGGGRRR